MNGPWVRAYRPSSRPNGSGDRARAATRRCLAAAACPARPAAPAASVGIGPYCTSPPIRTRSPAARRRVRLSARLDVVPRCSRRSDLGGGQRTENPQQIGDLVDRLRARRCSAQPLQLGLGVGHGVAGPAGRAAASPSPWPSSSASRVGSTREGGRPPLGERRVALVQELRDIAEQQRRTRTATGSAWSPRRSGPARASSVAHQRRPAPARRTRRTGTRGPPRPRSGTTGTRTPPPAAASPAGAAARAAAACRSAGAATAARGPRTPGSGPRTSPTPPISAVTSASTRLRVEHARTRRSPACDRPRTRRPAAAARCRRRRASPRRRRRTAPASGPR